MQKFWNHLLELVMSGKLTPDMVITHNLPLSEAAKGYDMFHKKVGCSGPSEIASHLRLGQSGSLHGMLIHCITLHLDAKAQPESAMHLSSVLSQACIPPNQTSSTALSGFHVHACRRAIASRSSFILDYLSIKL